MAKKILIDLIGKQIIPNLLPMYEFKPDFNILVASEDTKKIAQTIQDVCTEKKIELVDSVDQNSIDDVKNKIKNKITELLEKNNLQAEDCEFYFNYTGGTKQMSIALYSIYQEYKEKDNCHLFYSIEGNKYVLDSTKKDYATKLKLEDYLRIQLKVSDLVCNDEKPMCKKEFTKNVFNNYEQFIYHPLINFLRDKRTSERGITLSDEELEFLKNCKLLPEGHQNHLTQNEIKYITGDWLEEYVYNSIPEGIDKKLSIKTMRNGNTINEYDVIILYNNQLYVFECKTTFDARIANETNYKSSALIKKFGAKDKSYIVYLKMPGYNRPEATLIKRAKEEHIEAITPEYLPKIFK